MKSSKGGMNRNCLRVFIVVMRNNDPGNLEEFNQAYGAREGESIIAKQRHGIKWPR